MKTKALIFGAFLILSAALANPAWAGANGQITSPLAGSAINFCPTVIVARVQHPSGVNNVRFFAYFDGGYHYAGADYTGTDVGGGWFEFTGTWDCSEAVANPQTVKIRIDVYPNVGAPLPDEDEQDNITLNRTPAAAITSPTNPPTTEITDCPQQVQVTVNHPNGADYVTFYAWYDSYWHYFGRDYSAPFSASWDCSGASDQAGVKLRIDVYVTGIGLAQEVDVQGNFDLNKTPAAAITSPTNPPIVEINDCPQPVQSTVNHPNGADYVTFYAWYDSSWHYAGRDYSAPYAASWDCSAVSNQPGVKFRIDVYITGVGLAQEVDIQGDFNLNKIPAGAITSPTNPPTTEINYCPQNIQAAVNHPNGADYVTFYVWYDSSWHYIYRDYSAPYNASWDCGEAVNQSGVKFSIDVYVTGIGLASQSDVTQSITLDKITTASIDPAPSNPVEYCPKNLAATVNHPNGADYITFYVWYDDSWHYIGRDYAAPYNASWDCGEAADQSGVKFRIDAYITGVGLGTFADLLTGYTLAKKKVGEITSPIDEYTICGCPASITATASHPDGINSVSFYAWYDSDWHYITRDYSYPYTASWNCDYAADQSGIKFRIDVFTNAGGSTTDADEVQDLTLSKSFILKGYCSDSDVVKSLWGPVQAGALDYWHEKTLGSSSIIVAVIDTGVDYTHEDLAANIWVNTAEANNGRDDDGNGYIDDSNHGFDFQNATQEGELWANDSDAAMDPTGHGTQLAGVIAAVGDNAVGIVGMASGCKIMPLRATDSYKTALAVRYAADNGAKIIAMGLNYGTVPPQILYEAIQYATGKGLLVLAGTGNDSSSVVYYPSGWDGYVEAVGSTSAQDLRSTFSNYGAHLDLAAPGEYLKTTTLNNSYVEKSGTFISLGIATGAAALIWSYNPGYTAAQVADALHSAVKDISPSGKDQYTGWGRINLCALTSSCDPKGAVTSPTFGTTITSCPATISAVAAGGYGINSVSFSAYYDGAWHSLGEDTTAPYSQSWDCSLVSNQVIRLKIDVMDSRGITKTDADIQRQITLQH